MNIITHSITQPTRERFDFDARCRWEGEGGLQQPPFDRELPWSGGGWPLRIGMAGILRRMTASFAGPLNWLVSSDGRFARDTRELFGIPPRGSERSLPRATASIPSRG
jgi:hypothetical protein